MNDTRNDHLSMRRAQVNAAHAMVDLYHQYPELPPISWSIHPYLVELAGTVKRGEPATLQLYADALRTTIHASYTPDGRVHHYEAVGRHAGVHVKVGMMAEPTKAKS